MFRPAGIIWLGILIVVNILELFVNNLGIIENIISSGRCQNVAFAHDAGQLINSSY